MEYEGWHFIANNRLRDGSEPAPAGGVEHYSGKLALCRSGLHASARALNALSYAPDGRLRVRRVRLTGEVAFDRDKGVASERHILAELSEDETERALHEFMLWCAEQVRQLMVDERSRHALDVKRRWLDGEATEEELAAAMDAAWDAVGKAAWVAAGAASMDAARAAIEVSRDATMAAAWAAIMATARVADINIIWDATMDGVRDAQNAELERLLNEAIRAQSRQDKGV